MNAASSRPAIAQINHSHLRYNYALLKTLAGSADIMAIVKANAYGHGMLEIAASLSNAGCQSFGVTDACEGIRLRQSLSYQGSTEIALLSGLFDEHDAVLASNGSLTPVITNYQHVYWLKAAGFSGRVWIKTDSGMNRLGAVNPAKLIAQCREANIIIGGLMSHLSCADTPEHPMNKRQLETFNTCCEQIAPDLPRSLLNSAGMVIMPEYAMDTVRPGIALYGSEPVQGKKIGLKPVMSLFGSIMQLREIPANTPVSYGASFIAPHNMTIATVSLGYADGVPRALSNLGSVIINHKECRIIGRICMDYSIIDVSQLDVALGDQVEFWGEEKLANDVATQLDTISYTLFTGVGNRVQRIKGN